jgi:hypothetical protein
MFSAAAAWKSTFAAMHRGVTHVRCAEEWFPAPNRGRVDVLSNLESALNVLADLEVRDAQVRREVDHVERALGRIRDVMYENRWI